jgi:trans-aconitate methyltransferase
MSGTVPHWSRSRSLGLGSRCSSGAILCATSGETTASSERKSPRIVDLGHFGLAAAARGAEVCGIDAAKGMIEIARWRVPGAHLRIGAIERLPWREDSFDVISGFNAFQFAADIFVALGGAERIARAGGRVAIGN